MHLNTADAVRWLVTPTLSTKLVIEDKVLTTLCHNLNGQKPILKEAGLSLSEVNLTFMCFFVASYDSPLWFGVIVWKKVNRRFTRSDCDLLRIIGLPQWHMPLTCDLFILHYLLNLKHTRDWDSWHKLETWPRNRTHFSQYRSNKRKWIRITEQLTLTNTHNWTGEHTNRNTENLCYDIQ